MSTRVRQIQVVHGDIAANRLLAEGWIYLQSVASGGTVAHVLGSEPPVPFDDKPRPVHREAIPISRSAAMPARPPGGPAKVQ
jgi:hypothetical protein